MPVQHLHTITLVISDPSEMNKCSEKSCMWIFSNQAVIRSFFHTSFLTCLKFGSKAAIAGFPLQVLTWSILPLFLLLTSIWSILRKGWMSLKLWSFFPSKKPCNTEETTQLLNFDRWPHADKPTCTLILYSHRLESMHTQVVYSVENSTAHKNRL